MERALTDTPSRSGRRRRASGIWLLIALIIAIGAGGWLALNRPWQAKPLAVPTEVATAAPVERVLAVNGRVVPDRQVEISSTVSGRVKSVEASEGGKVLAGTTMLSMDDTQQQAVVAQVQSSLDAARGRLSQASVDLERAKGLGDSISQKALNDAELALQTAAKEVDRLVSAQDQALSLLAEYTVKAPFDGTVLAQAADPGQVVSSSTVLFSFADLDKLNAEASVDELYSAELGRGVPVKARPSGYGEILDGEVIYVSPSVDASTGGRLVRVSLPDAAKLHLPVALTITLNIIVDKRDRAITVPRSAIVQGGAPAVYVIENGHAARKAIQYLDWPSDRLIVTDGLSGGEVVITDIAKVTEGSLVATKE